MDSLSVELYKPMMGGETNLELRESNVEQVSELEMLRKKNEDLLKRNSELEKMLSSQPLVKSRNVKAAPASHLKTKGTSSNTKRGRDSSTESKLNSSRKKLKSDTNDHPSSSSSSSDDKSSSNTSIVNSEPATKQRTPRRSWETVKEMLLRYKEINGNLLIPANFRIPIDSPDWPESMWGTWLGHVVNAIRSRGSYGGNKEELEAMGFWFGKSRNEMFESVKSALLVYLKLHGDFNVPTDFKVPMNNPLWPEDTWGMSLGHRANTIRRNEAYTAHRPELIALGFTYDSKSNVVGWHKLRLALLTYKSIFGNLLVPYTFTVPSKTDMWPKSTWGIRLGYRVCGIRSHNFYKEHRDEMVEMGFVFGVRFRSKPSDKN